MKRYEIGAFEAKTRLSQILDQVDKGRVFVITRRGRPVAELRPIPRPVGLRFGSDAGRIRMGNDFDEPIPDLEPYTR